MAQLGQYRTYIWKNTMVWVKVDWYTAADILHEACELKKAHSAMSTLDKCLPMKTEYAAEMSSFIVTSWVPSLPSHKNGQKEESIQRQKREEGGRGKRRNKGEVGERCYVSLECFQLTIPELFLDWQWLKLMKVFFPVSHTKKFKIGDQGWCIFFLFLLEYSCFTMLC